MEDTHRVMKLLTRADKSSSRNYFPCQSESQCFKRLSDLRKQNSFRIFHTALAFVNIFPRLAFDQQFAGNWKCQSAWVSFQHPPQPHSKRVANYRKSAAPTMGQENEKLLIIKHDGMFCLCGRMKRKCQEFLFSRPPTIMRRGKEEAKAGSHNIAQHDEPNGWP